jgi:hypothetical protein
MAQFVPNRCDTPTWLYGTAEATPFQNCDFFSSLFMTLFAPADVGVEARAFRLAAGERPEAKA